MSCLHNSDRRANDPRMKRFYVVLPFVFLSLLAYAGCVNRYESGGALSRSGHSEFLDRTKNGASPQLVARAEKALRGNIEAIWERSYNWSSKNIFDVCTDRGDQGVFVEKGRDYIQINSGLKIELLNEILQEYPITRQDMNRAGSTRHFLEFVVGLCDGPGRTVGSSNFLRNLGSRVSHWARNDKKTEMALRELCHDPQFVFDGNHWVVEFNVLNPDGGAVRWRVSGEFCPETQSNSIDTIERHVLKKKGTFAYTMYG